MSPTPGDSVRVSVTVAADPATAFAIFTEETDLWWKRGVKYRVAGRRPGTLLFEKGLGGRLFEQFEKEAGRTEIVVSGRITVWEPPERFAFEWRAVNFTESDPSTEVEVTFAPVGSKTNVTLVHRGFTKLRDGHPVRHGADAAGFQRTMGLWWGELLSSYRDRMS